MVGLRETLIPYIHATNIYLRGRRCPSVRLTADRFFLAFGLFSGESPEERPVPQPDELVSGGLREQHGGRRTTRAISLTCKRGELDSLGVSHSQSAPNKSEVGNSWKRCRQAVVMAKRIDRRATQGIFGGPPRGEQDHPSKLERFWSGFLAYAGGSLR